MVQEDWEQRKKLRWTTGPSDCILGLQTFKFLQFLIFYELYMHSLHVFEELSELRKRQAIQVYNRGLMTLRWLCRMIINLDSF